MLTLVIEIQVFCNNIEKEWTIENPSKIGKNVGYKIICPRA